MCARCWVLFALFCAIPTTALASPPFFARLDLMMPNDLLSVVKSASIRAKTTNQKGANGLLVTAKVSGARDTTGNLANLTLMAQVGFRVSFPSCSQAPFAVPITNGSGSVTVTGTDLGLSETNTNPGRALYLCSLPQMLNQDFTRDALVFDLYSSSPGTILFAPFILDPFPPNPITSWRKATFLVQNVKGSILATTSISGAQENGAPSSRTIIPEIPQINVDSCIEVPYLFSGVALDKGRGKSTTPNLATGNPDPGFCIYFRVGLEDTMSDAVSEGLGVVQGIDRD